MLGIVGEPGRHYPLRHVSRDQVLHFFAHDQHFFRRDSLTEELPDRHERTDNFFHHRLR